MTQQFLPQYRLVRQADFELVYRARRSASDESMLVFVRYNDLLYSRIGLSVGRKWGNAVVRNRWKRLLREAFRLRREELPLGIDLVVVPRASQSPSLAQLQESLIRVVGRAAAKLRVKQL